MPDTKQFNSIVRGLRKDIGSLAGLTVRKYRRSAERDGKNLLKAMEGDLKRWSNLLEKDALTTSDFEWLVQSQAATVKMTALEKSALADMRVDQFRGSVILMIIDTMFDALLGRSKSKR